MSDEEKLQLENECLLKYSKAQMIQKYIDELEENCTLSDLWCKSQEENKQLHSTIKEVRDNLENSIKSINEKLKNNKEPFEVIDGRIQYINDYRVVRLKAFRTKCKELLEILDKEVN